MANMIARLGVLLGLDSAEFNKGLADAGRKLEQFSKAAETYGKVAATALAAASYAALNYADQLADVAVANDVAIDTILKLSNALENSGGKAENSAKLLAGFTKFIDTAAEGSLSAQQHLAKMGISLKDVGNLSTEEIFNKTVTNLAAIEDPLTRNARAMEIFGKAAKGVDFVGLADEMKNATSITFEQAKAVQDAADMHDLLAQHARNTTLTLATELGPVLKTTIQYIKEMSGENNVLAETFKTIFQTVAVLGANVAFVFKGIGDEIAHTYENAKVLATEGIQAAIKLNKEYDAYRENEAKKLANFEQRIMNPDGGMGRFDSGSGSGWDADKGGPKRLTKVAVDPEVEKMRRHQLMLMKKGREEELRVIAETNKALGDQEEIYRKGYMTELLSQEVANKQLDRQQEMFDLSIRGQNMRSEDLTLAQDLLQIEYKRKDNIEAITRNETLTREAREAALIKENDLAQKGISLALQRNAATRATRDGTFGEGMEKGMSKFFRDLPTELENGQKAFDSVVGNMEQALNNFVKTGKLSFKDLARSIIQDIIAIQLRAQASGLMGMLMKSLGFGGGSISGPSSSVSTWDAPGFADGGDPQANKISMVGERGPELFVPKTAGTIIPNHALSGMGGTTNVTNNYINAIDTKSFEQRLLGSSSAIWAANKYGEKNLASSFGRT
ncbi:Bacteriophage lambda, GpH, tail tape measure, C-terminal [uncultured Caudovirales phage]|uniref:Bacteriophage lambda, GpH, tail tape measure, C-terminal n=1 Tax=uncultured Caudovirales phage TaxID=2100421 RepID=A0A6J5MJW1_9CAUD|nr:Bacteriophage lambda, GpH, tail tape measure, C-terminal [uncultured Caudovirales phage]